MAYNPRKRIYLLVDGRYLNVYRGDTFLLEHTRDVFQLPTVDDFVAASAGAAWFLNVNPSPQNDKLGWFDSDFNGSSTGYSLGDTGYGSIGGASSDGATLLLGGDRIGVFDTAAQLTEKLSGEQGFTRAGMSPKHPGFYSFENDKEVVLWSAAGVEQSRVPISTNTSLTFQFSALDTIARDPESGDFVLSANVFDGGAFKERAAIRMSSAGVRIYYVVLPADASAVQTFGSFLYYDADNSDTGVLDPVVINAFSGRKRSDLEAAISGTGVVNQVSFAGQSPDYVYFQGQVDPGVTTRLYGLDLKTAVATEIPMPAGVAPVVNPELKGGDGWVSFLGDEGGTVKRFFLAEGETDPSKAVRAESIAEFPDVEFLSFGVPDYDDAIVYCQATPFWEEFVNTEEVGVALGGICISTSVAMAGSSLLTGVGTTEPESTVQTFDYSAQVGTSGRLLLVRPDESKVHVADLLGLGDSTMYQYSMSPAGNLGGATYDSVTFNTGWWFSVPEGILFGDSGNLLIQTDNNSGLTALSGLPAPYDLDVDAGTLSDDYGGLGSVAGLDNPGAIRGLVFNSAGTTLMAVGASSNDLFAVTLGTAWSPSSGYTLVGAFDIGPSTFGTVTGGCGTSDGLTFYVTTDNSGTDTITKYTMTTPFDPTTASLDGTLDVSADGDGLWGIGISGDDATLYLLFQDSQTVVSMPAF